ncbi:MAG TPA: glycosyltransferase [Selenomonadales bacterium]|nr:glycosyltransferase [Selenomonadales bacterium]
MNSSLSGAILREETLSSAQSSDNAFHVAFGVDAHYIKGMGITILSLLENNPDIRFVFHVFHSSITPADYGRLNQLVSENPTTVKLYQLNQETFRQLPTFAQFTSAIYNRLVVADKLKGVATKVLYLDADIVCLGNISELFSLKMGENIVAAVQATEHAVARQTKKLNITANRYFNSGVIYMDIDKWHAHDISAKALQLIVENYATFAFPDQDALNIALNNKVLYIDPRWNYLYDLDKDAIPADTVLLHYAGRTKPWCEWYVNPMRSHFLKYYRQSPWKDVAFNQPTHYKHMKAFARVCRKNGELGKSIYWYLKYLKFRFKHK